MSRHTHWHILGAGAMGCLWAYHLKQAGHDATLLLRDSHTPTATVTLERDNTKSAASVNSCSAVKAGSITHLLVATKATDTVQAVLAHQQALADNCCIVLLQNGMGQHQALADALPNTPIYAALSTDGAWLRVPFHTVHAGRGLTRIGAITVTATHATLMPVLQGLALQTEWTDDITPALWLKLATNCAINGLTAIYRCSNGELLDGGIRQQRMQRLCHEVECLMQAEGITLPGDADCYASAIAIAQATAENRSSTLQDVLAGRRTELDALNGFVVRKAQQHGIPTPENSAVLAEVSAAR